MGFQILWQASDGFLGIFLIFSAVLLGKVDEAVGWGVVGRNWIRIVQLRLDRLGQLFAQLDPKKAIKLALNFYQAIIEVIKASLGSGGQLS